MVPPAIRALVRVAASREGTPVPIPVVAGHPRALVVAQLCRCLATSGSASDARLQSSVLWVALRQRSHLSDLLALAVKQIAYSDWLIRDKSVSPRAAAWRLYATSYAAHAVPSYS